MTPSQPSNESHAESSSFRKRRLSLPLMSVAGPLVASIADDDDASEIPPSSEDAPAPNEVSVTPEDGRFRKRRLSLATPSPDAKRACFVEEAAEPRPKKSRTVHAGEILEMEAPTTRGPRWTHRLTVDPVKEADRLPFAPDVVGTFSCHGVEPAEQSEEEDEGDGEIKENQSDADTFTPLQQFFVTGDLEDPQVVSFEEPNLESVCETCAKINQDRGGVVFPYGKSDKTALFAVYDGHGPGGETVSQFSLNEVQRRLESHGAFLTNLPVALTDTFLAVDHALRSEPGIDPLFAGSTACVALFRDTTLTMANAGDSRAVCARRASSGALIAIDLTKDQNPDDPHELIRIQQRGGFVTPPPAPGLSARVWLDAECTQVGLAMARSLGDHAVGTVGVIAQPVISTHCVQSEDEFMILATDGVWEFISSQEAVDIVGSNIQHGASKACQVLIETAAKRWKAEEGAYRDDITAIVVKLQNLFVS